MLEIRKALKKEAPQIAKLMILAMEEITYYLIGKEDSNEAILFLTDLIAKENNQYSYEHCYVAVDNAVVLAQINLYPGDQMYELRKPILSYIMEKYHRELSLEDETQAGEIYIDTIAVSPAAQGKGIGKQLLNFVIQKFVVEDEKTLGLLVEKSNPGAKKLYTAMGFEELNSFTIFNKEMHHLQITKDKNK